MGLYGQMYKNIKKFIKISYLILLWYKTKFMSKVIHVHNVSVWIKYDIKNTTAELLPSLVTHIHAAWVLFVRPPKTRGREKELIPQVVTEPLCMPLMPQAEDVTMSKEDLGFAFLGLLVSWSEYECTGFKILPICFIRLTLASLINSWMDTAFRRSVPADDPFGYLGGMPFALLNTVSVLFRQ